ncbi:MAG: RidA family protein [Cyclobacteriaceae bacterium]
MVKTIIETPNAPEPIGPYSQAIMANGTLYVSGQIALDPVTMQIKTDDVEAQTHQVMKNLRAILASAELSFRDVVKCSIFVKNMDDFAKINAVYGEYFDTMTPARETVEVSRLPKDVLVEISCIAVK